MIPIILAVVIAAFLVGGPFLLCVAHLRRVRDQLSDELEAAMLREKTQRSRAVTTELALTEMRRRSAEAERRCAIAEGWCSGDTSPEEGHPSSRHVSPPPHDGSRVTS